MIMQGWVCVDIVDVAERLPFLLREPKFPPMPKRAPKHDKAKAGKLSAESQVKSYQPEFTMRSARKGGTKCSIQCSIIHVHLKAPA